MLNNLKKHLLKATSLTKDVYNTTEKCRKYINIKLYCMILLIKLININSTRYRKGVRHNKIYTTSSHTIKMLHMYDALRKNVVPFRAKKICAINMS